MMTSGVTGTGIRMSRFDPVKGMHLQSVDSPGYPVREKEGVFAGIITGTGKTRNGCNRLK